MTPTSWRILALVLPPLAALAALHPCLDADFAYDDPVAVTGNPLVNGQAPWSDAFTQNFWGDREGFDHLASWRPLTVLSLRLDHALGGGTPAAFHTTNLLLHLLVLLTLVLLALALGLPPPAALLTGLIAAVHPALAEAVASIVGRGDLLAALFGLLALRLAADPQRPRHLLALAPLLLALLAKESAVVFIAPLLALLWLRSDRRPAGGLTALALLTIAWYAARATVVGHLGGDVPLADNQLAGLGLVDRLGGALAVVGRYTSWLLLPQPIAADHGPAVDLAGAGSVFVIVGALSGLALAAAALVALKHRRAAPLVALSLLICALGLLSNLLFVLPTPMAGRLAYLPGLGAALLAGHLAARLPASRRAVLAVVAGGWLLAGAGASYLIASAWADDGRLFTAAAELQPKSVRALVNVARQLANDGEPQPALVRIEAARALSPDHPLVLANLPPILARAGHPEEAWAATLRAIELSPRPGRAHANLCALALEQKRPLDAQIMGSCAVGAKLVVDAAEPLVNEARALATLGRTQEAEAGLREALRHFPDDPFALGHLTAFVASRGRLDEALDLQRRLLAVQPDHPTHLKNLVGLLLQGARVAQRDGNGELACARAREAASLAPEGPGVAAVAALCPR